MGNRRRILPSPVRALAICAVFLALAVLCGVCVGAGSLRLFQLLDAAANPDSPMGRILYHVRMPRTLATVLAGAGLAVAGVITQSVLENTLASPGIIGVNAGAGFAAILCAAFFPSAVRITPLAAFAGALVTVLVVYGAARKAGASRMTLVLAGVAVSSLLGAGIDAIATVYPDALMGTNSFRVGGVQGVTLAKLFPAWVLILAGIGIALLLAGELDILGLGDTTAKSLGLNTGAYRFAFLVLAAALAGAAVSFAGLLGFVGLMVPHIARMLAGNGSRALIGVSALGGAGFLTLCDVIARTAFAPYELPVGIFVSFLGTPFFLWLLFKGRGRQAHD